MKGHIGDTRGLWSSGGIRDKRGSRGYGRDRVASEVYPLRYGGGNGPRCIRWGIGDIRGMGGIRDYARGRVPLRCGRGHGPRGISGRIGDIRGIRDSWGIRDYGMGGEPLRCGSGHGRNSV
jgi:hypothetical protein